MKDCNGKVKSGTVMTSKRVCGQDQPVILLGCIVLVTLSNYIMKLEGSFTLLRMFTELQSLNKQTKDSPT